MAQKLLSTKSNWKIFNKASFELLEERFSTIPSFLFKRINTWELNFVTLVSAQYATIYKSSLWKSWLFLSCSVLKFETMQMSKSFRIYVNLEKFCISWHNHTNNRVIFLWIIFVRVKWQNINLDFLLFLFTFRILFFAKICHCPFSM